MNKQKKSKKQEIMIIGKASKLTLGTKWGRIIEYNKPGFIRV